MSILFALLIGIVFAEKRQYPQYISDYMIDEYAPSNSTDSLGICYGSSITWDQEPYVVALRYRSSSSDSPCCTGSIISLDPPIILTAAHCERCGSGLVRIGCDDPQNCNGDTYFIDQFVVNSGYGSPWTASNDIAIVRLTNPITTNNAEEAVIPTTELPDGQEVLTVGYGVQQGNGGYPRWLQEGDYNVFNRAECDVIMTPFIGESVVDISMVCYLDESHPEKTMTCSADSGGPSGVRLNGQMVVYGVTSWGPNTSYPPCKKSGCKCCISLPTVCANVPHFASWINGYIGAWNKGDFNYTAPGDKHYFYNHK